MPRALMTRVHSHCVRICVRVYRFPASERAWGYDQPLFWGCALMALSARVVDAEDGGAAINRWHVTVVEGTYTAYLAFRSAMHRLAGGPKCKSMDLLESGRVIDLYPIPRIHTFTSSRFISNYVFLRKRPLEKETPRATANEHKTE
jgi:hypothetical protein